MLETLEPRCLLATLSGEVFVDANGDSQRGPGEDPAAFIRVYLDANDNLERESTENFVVTDATGAYTFTNIAAGDHVVRVEPPEGQNQTSPTAFFGTGYTTIGPGTNPTQLFEMGLDGTVRPIGVPTTERIHDLVQTNDGTILGVSFQTDSIYSIDPLTGQETLLATATVDLVAGLAYDPDTDTVYTVAQEPGGTALILRTIDQATGQLDPTEVAASGVRAINFGSTFYDFDTATETAVMVPRQTLSPFASTLDVDSNGNIHGLQGRSLNRYSFPAAGSTATTLSTLSQTIEAISFDANDTLFGISTSPSTFHQIDPGTGTVSAGIPITFGGNSISGVTGFDIAPDGTHYLVDSTHLYTFDPGTGVATQAPNRGLPTTPIFTSLSVGADGDLFATLFDVATPLAQIDPVTGLATRLGNGPLGAPYAAVVAQSASKRLSGLTGVSDLTFDTVNDRIVGFDNDTDQFFEFSTSGVVKVLATAERPLNSWSLAFDGTGFVMFDQDDPNKTQTLVVDPDTGTITDGFLASQPIPTEGLFHAKRGNIAYRVSVADTDDVTGLNFGLTDIAAAFKDHPTVINELLLDPLFGNRDTDQLIEIRGEPGGQLRPNTYLVVVDEENLTRGEITGIFNLSDQPLGANGMLVLRQLNSPHVVDPDSAVLTSTETGFGNLPGDIYTDIFAATDRVDSTLVAANGYFLIESDTPPMLNDDIDGDDNGLIDPNGIVSQWNILDSISMHPFVGSGDQAYGRILVAEEELNNDPSSRTVAPGTPIVTGNGAGYAARVGDSIGSDPDDWMFGVVEYDDTAVGTPTAFRVSEFVSHLPNPFVFLNRTLDHFGESNFVGGVRGRALQFPAFGQPDITVPLVGATIFADTNGNGTRDLITYSVDPDDGIDPDNLVDGMGNPIPQVLTHAYPGVTLSTADRIFGDQPINFEVRSIRESTNPFIPNPNRIFAHLDIGFFLDTRKLRADFHEPVREASIQAIGTGSITSTVYGRIEAYNDQGILIDTDLSGPLLGSARETITVTSSSDDIAYILAYSDTTTFPNASPFGRLDRLSYKQIEPGAVTDLNGLYEIKNLFPDQYDIIVEGSELLETNVASVEVTRYENFVVNPAVRFNSPPQIDAEIEMMVDENSPSGTFIGLITPIELDGQNVTFKVIDGAESGLRVNEMTGAVTVGPGAVLDFEQTPMINLVVEVSDSIATVVTSVSVLLKDLNEAPVVGVSNFFVAEGTVDGTAIGRVEAFDPDAGQTLSFAIVPPSSIFSIHPTSGVVTLVDASAIDFETVDEIVLPVVVTDSAMPSLSTSIAARVRIVDENDPPVITTTSINVTENSRGVVGRIMVTDPDAGQTHAFELLNPPGSGAEFFTLRRNGEIVVREGKVIDFESAQSYSLNVIVIDSGIPPRTDDATVTLNITNVNEPPTITPKSVGLDENSEEGTFVATLSVLDPENSGADYALELLDDGDAANFNFDPATKTVTVATGAELDFEGKRLQTLFFRITDPTGGDNPTVVSLQIELQDKNDPPVVLTSRVVISELAQPGTVVGRIQVQVREPDIGDAVTVHIVGPAGEDRFTLDPVTRILRIAPGAQFDADTEQDPVFIEVEVRDSTYPAAGSSSVGRIDVVVNNVNEPPVFEGGPPTPSPVSSGQPFTLTFPSVVDPEGGSFSLAVFDPATGALPSWLKFNKTTRILSGLPTPGEAAIGVYNLTVRAFELGSVNLFSDLSFQVQVELGGTPLSNQLIRSDVDGNGIISPLDVLRIINYVDRHGNNSRVIGFPFTGFVDVSFDGFVSVFDALLAINDLELARLGAGEAVAPVAGEDDDLNHANDEALVDLLSESSLF